MDLEELSQRAKEGKSLYGDSPQPAWVQGSAHRNSVYSQLKFCKSSFSYQGSSTTLMLLLSAAFPMYDPYTDNL